MITHCSHEECLKVGNEELARACSDTRESGNVRLGTCKVRTANHDWIEADVVTPEEACRRLGLTNVKDLPTWCMVVFNGKRTNHNNHLCGGYVRYNFVDAYRARNGGFEAGGRGHGIVEEEDGSYVWKIFA